MSHQAKSDTAQWLTFDRVWVTVSDAHGANLRCNEVPPIRKAFSSAAIDSVRQQKLTMSPLTTPMAEQLIEPARSGNVAVDEDEDEDAANAEWRMSTTLSDVFKGLMDKMVGTCLFYSLWKLSQWEFMLTKSYTYLLLWPDDWNCTLRQLRPLLSDCRLWEWEILYIRCFPIKIYWLVRHSGSWREGVRR